MSTRDGGISDVHSPWSLIQSGGCTVQCCLCSRLPFSSVLITSSLPQVLREPLSLTRTLSQGFDLAEGIIKHPTKEGNKDGETA